MLTLGDLRKKIIAEPHFTEIPTAKSLRFSGKKIIAEKRFDPESSMTVYQDGFVIYQRDRKVTVFPVSICGDYHYMDQEQDITIAAECFDQEPWYIRLLLEGEDRLCENAKRFHEKHTVLYEAYSENWKVLEAPNADPLQDYIAEETLELLLLALTPKQKLVIQRRILEQESRKNVAEELGIQPPSVNDFIDGAMKKMKSVYEKLQEGRNQGNPSRKSEK